MQAAQALEPAALVAMRLVRPGGSVALVGDPKQLPATVLSQAASSRHLAQSLFERLQRVRSARKASSVWCRHCTPARASCRHLEQTGTQGGWGMSGKLRCSESKIHLHHLHSEQAGDEIEDGLACLAVNSS